MVAEIPYIPADQRQTTIKSEVEINDGIVVVGQRQKKRKRKDKRKEDAVDSPAASDSGERSKKRKSVEKEGNEMVKVEVVPFDFASAPNILDNPSTTNAPAPAKKKREKGQKLHSALQ